MNNKLIKQVQKRSHCKTPFNKILVLDPPKWCNVVFFFKIMTMSHKLVPASSASWSFGVFEKKTQNDIGNETFRLILCFKPVGTKRCMFAENNESCFASCQLHTCVWTSSLSEQGASVTCLKYSSLIILILESLSCVGHWTNKYQVLYLSGNATQIDPSATQQPKHKNGTQVKICLNSQPHEIFTQNITCFKIKVLNLVTSFCELAWLSLNLFFPETKHMLQGHVFCIKQTVLNHKNRSLDLQVIWTHPALRFSFACNFQYICPKYEIVATPPLMNNNFKTSFDSTNPPTTLSQ